MTTTEFQKSTAREYFESILVAVILALFVRTFVFQAFKIPTGSMKPNLLVGDHLLVNKFIFAPAATPIERALLPMRDIRRGDVIVFKFPEEPERDFIKRVIGLPGETLELKNQTISINGTPLIEPYAHYLFPPAAEGDRGLAGPAAPLRSGHRAGRPLLHDGRQPRRLAGQPLLGLPAAVLHQGPGPVHLLVVRHARRRLGCQLVPRNPLGPAASPNPLRSSEFRVGNLNSKPERPIRH